MSSLYSVIPGLVPSQQEIVEAELLAKQILEGEFPDLDLREGTGLRDLVLRPTAYAFALLRKATDYYFEQNTLKGVNDSTPEEMVDDLLSNWFLTRSTGTYAMINARLYFARQKNVTITSDIGFSPDNSRQYFPIENKVYNASAMSYDAYNNEWYLDVDLRAADTGTDYNISEGSLLYFTVFDPYFLRGEINYLAEESTPSETNTQFIKRASTAISTRNLINEPSIDNRIREIFNYVPRVVTVGAGDVNMIRDMIKVVFDQEPSYTPVSADIQGQNVIFDIGEHTFSEGQSVVLSGADPEVFNSEFLIVATTSSSITVLVPNNPGYISPLPSITRSIKPVFVHNGGMVDVYCGERISSEIVQITTDSKGVGRIEGAVFSMKRSEASGGDSDDTIPVNKVVAPDSFTVDQANKAIVLSDPDYRFSVGESVTVEGISQSKTITSISCTGLTVQAIVPGHEIAVGKSITISGVAPSSYNGTYTVTAVGPNWVQYEVHFLIPTAGSAATNSTMTISNASLPAGAAIISDSNNVLTVALPSLWPSTSVTGSVTVSSPVVYTVRNPYLRQPQSVIMYVDNGITRVLWDNHGCEIGRMVTITNSTIPEINGSWKINTVNSASEFTIVIPALSEVLGQSATGKAVYVDHRYDYGFSPRQILEVDFGSGYADKTASFELSAFRDVAGIQEYLESAEYRVLCGDLLARGFNIHTLDVEVVSYSGTPASDTTVRNTLETYLKSLSPGDSLVISDIISALNDAGVSNIKTPIGVKYTRYNRDLTTPETGTITDRLDPLDKTNVFLLQSVTNL